MDEKFRSDNPSPLNKAGILSQTFLWWISPLLKLGKERPLLEEDLYNPVPEEECKRLTEDLEREWDKELKKRNPSLSLAFARLYWLKIVFLTIILSTEEFIKMCFPIIISRILKYFEGSIGFKEAIIYAICISIGATINCIIHHPYFLQIGRVGLRMRLASSGLIYKKAFKLNLSDSDNGSGGQLLNMLSNDGSRIESSLYFVPYILIGPIQAVIIIYTLVETIDVSILSGLLILVIAVPTQSLLGKVLDRLRRIVAKKCDKRISLLNEIFNGIKIIKMYCWEEPFKKIADLLRKKEIKYQKRLYMLNIFNSTIDITLPCLITFTSVTFFIQFANRPLTPSYIVLAMSFYMRISNSMGFFFIKAVTGLIGAKVSFQRMQEFLLKKELIKSNQLQSVKNPYIKVSNLNARWLNEVKQTTLKNISFEAYQGDLVAIIGSVGAGKSSLLVALLDELQKVSGEIDIKGKVFYVPQEPWIFTASLRQNILFGKPYNKEKFEKIIKVCCLDEDLKSLSHGERTLIGEKGINLSGGQRARVSVARALYSDAQIYLFDDPLSAVDVNVAKKLYENCLNKYLKSKIRILVTHQVHHLAFNVTQIIYLTDGEIKFKGSYQELVNSGINMDMIAEQINSEKESLKSRKNSRADNQNDSISEYNRIDSLDTKSLLNSSHFSDLNSSNLMINSYQNEKEEKIDSKDNLEYEEKRVYGIVSWQTFFNYFKVGGGLIGAFFCFIICLVSQTLLVVSDYWVSHWASIEDSDMIKKLRNKSDCLNCTSHDDLFQKPDFSNLNPYANRDYYYQTYCILVSLSVFFSALRISIFYTLATKSAVNLHKNMFNKVLKSPIRFFDVNPIGRIMNRFSKDIGQIDDTIPATVMDFLIVLMMVLGSVCMSFILNYWVLIPTAPLTILFLYVRKYFLATSMEIKRIDGIVRSPIFVHVNNSVSGMIIIRASNMENKINEEFYVHNDYHTRAAGAFMFVNRWLGIRLDWIATLFTYTAVFSCIFLFEFEILKLEPGEVGIMLVYLLQLVGLFQWCIRQSCEVENLMTSVERVLEYTDLDTEPLEIGLQKPPKDWPLKGEIKFHDVSYKYEKNLPNVLNNLTLTIHSGEKIGIVGRTGAGKSSIIQTLFRMAEPNGVILIDNLNIKEISLHDLRNKLSIIPQEPTLFIGTIRSNLDPFNQYPDNILWDSLEQVQLKETIKEMKDGLDSEVYKTGSNLSVGQKQLICLARAIIKKSKILIIDEATANVDFKTDALVQNAIRECFKDCTVLTIAHRLHTIIDSDRIICLNKGRIENLGKPYDLIKDESTILHDLVFSLDKLERDKLIEISKKSYENIDNFNKTSSPIANYSESRNSVDLNNSENSEILSLLPKD